jgi:hypothetical protein
MVNNLLIISLPALILFYDNHARIDKERWHFDKSRNGPFPLGA